MQPWCSCTPRTRIETVASTDPVLAELDSRQMELGEGPDLSLVQGGDDVIVRAIGEDPRWPAWASAVSAAGLRSMIGVRLYTSQRTIGSLNLYDVRPDHFSEPDRQVAHVLARHAALALGRVQDSEHLLRAMDSRKLIGQAQGILMERFKLSPEKSFAVLRRYSQQHNIKLYEVAGALIRTGKLPEGSTDPTEPNDEVPTIAG